MKIFLVIPTLKQGGAERVMSEFANEFANQNHEVHLILLASAEDFYIIDDRITIHRMSYINRGKFRRTFDEMKVLFKLRSLLSFHRPDATLSFMDKYNVLTLLASCSLKLKVFVSDRSNPNKQISTFLSLLKVLTYRHAAGIIAQTSLAKEILEKNTRNKNIKIIPNPVKRVELFPQIKREKLIINIGRLVPEKGQEYLLEAFSKLNKPDWKLVILGEGPLHEELKTYCEDLNIENNVYMPGAVNNVDQWLAQSSIFAFTSISEGFPNALVEAMSAGLPCISFDCDAGPRDIIKDGVSGFLVPPKDVDELVVKLNELINKPDLRLSIGTKALEIKSKLDKEIIAERYVDFFQSY